jgi:hypothetical protein
MEVSVKFDKRAAKHVQRWATKQVEFATAKSLTKVAQKSQENIQRNIVRKFDTTKKWWAKNTPTGIKIKAANKRNLTAEVFTGTKNDWLYRHEFGKPRKAKKRSLVIPSYKKRMLSPDKADPKFSGIKPATWKKAVGVSKAFEKWGKRGFLVRRGGGGKVSSQKLYKGGTAKRKYPQVSLGRKPNTKNMVFIKRKKSDEKPELLFVLGRRNTKAMRKRLKMFETIEQTVDKEFYGIWVKEIAHAIATGR